MTFSVGVPLGRTVGPFLSEVRCLLVKVALGIRFGGISFRCAVTSAPVRNGTTGFNISRDAGDVMTEQRKYSSDETIQVRHFPDTVL